MELQPSLLPPPYEDEYPSSRVNLPYLVNPFTLRPQTPYTFPDISLPPALPTTNICVPFFPYAPHSCCQFHQNMFFAQYATPEPPPWTGINTIMYQQPEMMTPGLRCESAGQPPPNLDALRGLDLADSTRDWCGTNDSNGAFIMDPLPMSTPEGQNLSNVFDLHGQSPPTRGDDSVHTQDLHPKTPVTEPTELALTPSEYSVQRGVDSFGPETGFYVQS
ncbi:hypothetical protein E0Z10_g5319 [Xylaria hypoxylon]|uniref:Uncharacterized protein n=1 Tax=Xylaria hypoxylon TaxID=37992 RepID=A0A4Z0YHJ7_9PEZI|nr:hypothetical protein E0Z10_g5319 [Xylaria hypoxylon]